MFLGLSGRTRTGPTCSIRFSATRASRASMWLGDSGSANGGQGKKNSKGQHPNSRKPSNSKTQSGAANGKGHCDPGNLECLGSGCRKRTQSGKPQPNEFNHG